MKKIKGKEKGTKHKHQSTRSKYPLVMRKISKKMANSVPFCHKALDLTSSLGTPLTRARDCRFLWLLDTKGVLQVQEPYQFKKLPVTSKIPGKNNKWKDESQDSSTGSPRYSKHHILR